MNMLVLSDIHFGNNLNPTSNIIHNLDLFFSKYKRIIEKLDILIISGDVYDRLIEHASRESIEIASWLYRLVNLSRKQNMSLIILEGTETHDRHQIRLFSSSLKQLDIEVDFHYIEDIVIKQIKGFDFLLVPDNMDKNEDDADVVYKMVEDVFRKERKEKVDIAIMHGVFSYQIPVKIHSTHDEKRYLNLVKYNIIIGHHHVHSKYNDILVPGSFDRLTHGQEQPKGGLYIQYIGDEYTYTFLENVNAMPFITYGTKDLSVKEIIKKIKTLSKKHPYVNIRLIGDVSVLSEIVSGCEAGNVRFKTESPKKEVKPIDVSVEEMVITTITKDNILEEVKNNLHKRNVEDEDEILKEMKKLL